MTSEGFPRMGKEGYYIVKEETEDNIKFLLYLYVQWDKGRKSQLIDGGKKPRHIGTLDKRTKNFFKKVYVESEYYRNFNGYAISQKLVEWLNENGCRFTKHYEEDEKGDMNYIYINHITTWLDDRKAEQEHQTRPYEPQAVLSKKDMDSVIKNKETPLSKFEKMMLEESERENHEIDLDDNEKVTDVYPDGDIIANEPPKWKSKRKNERFPKVEEFIKNKSVRY